MSEDSENGQYRNNFIVGDRYVSVRVLNLGSGSSGNALLISNGVTSLLVDCGVGPRTIAVGATDFPLLKLLDG